MIEYIGDAFSIALDTTGFLWVCAIVATALVLRAAIGFGDGLLAVPLLTMLLDLSEAVPIILFLSTTMSLYPLWKERRHIQTASLGRTSIAAFIGIPLGVLLLDLGNEQLMKGALGILLIGLGWWQLRRPSQIRLQGNNWSYFFGVLAGTLGSAYALRGIVFSVYGGLRGWSAEKFKGTINAFYVASGVLLPMTYFGAGLITPRVVGFYLALLPLSVLATVVGHTLTSSINANTFQRAIWVFLMILGGVLVIRLFSIM